VLEGIARELISKVQTTRKSLGFNVTDHINMWIAKRRRGGRGSGAAR
jgi:hypothetical protein